jgi:DNA mismatch endonuclease (patch repair protein)
MLLRRALHRAGLRYRLHARDLPGRPDIVFRGPRIAVFVHGCFWHGHECRAGRSPATNRDYWLPKIAANRERDGRKARELAEAGWTVIVVWQCELRLLRHVVDRIIEMVGSRRPVSRLRAPPM